MRQARRFILASALQRALEDELRRSRRYERDFSIILLDLDRFKDTNDSKRTVRALTWRVGLSVGLFALLLLLHALGIIEPGKI